MAAVTVGAQEFVVDAALVGEAFGIDPAVVPDELRAGRITSRCETGVDEDAGRFRLTFFRNGRALRLTVDKQGAILSWAQFPVTASGAPLTRGKPKRE